MKEEKGITLITLAITVLIMIILLGAGIRYGSNSYSEVKLQNFSYEMQQIQGRVDTIHEKMSMVENTPNYIFLDNEQMGVNIAYSNAALKTLKDVKNIDYLSSELQTNEELYNKLYFKYTSGSNTQAYSYYRYFSASELESKLDLKNPKNDVIINFKTREVISVKRTKL